MKETKFQTLKKVFVIKMNPGFFVAKKSKAEEEVDPTIQWTWDIRKAKCSKSERTMESYIKDHKLEGCFVFWTGSQEELDELRGARR